MTRVQQYIDRIFEARRRANPPVKAPAKVFSDDEMNKFVLTTLGWGDYITMMTYIEKYAIDTGGRVARTSSHYVHYNTTDFTFDVDTYHAGVEIPAEEEAAIEELANKIEKQIDDETRVIHKKIYRALEKEDEYQSSDDAVDETLMANEYAFDENGSREDGGEYTIATLPTERAKEAAREWWKSGRFDDNFWSEHIVDEWKALLEEMGFDGIDIEWSGFWSQGDGASFTAKSFNFVKWAQWWMSGKADEQGHPYSDEKFEKPVAESFNPDELERFVDDVVLDDFSVFAKLDLEHEVWGGQPELRYQTEVRTNGSRFMARIIIYDRTFQKGKPGGVTVSVAVWAWEYTKDYHMTPPVATGKRDVKFFVPEGSKPKLVKLLMNYWDSVKTAGDDRHVIDTRGKLREPKKAINSVLYRLSKIATAWKAEVRDAYYDYLNSKTRQFTSDPAWIAAHDKKVQDWVAKHPEPSEEKLKLRAEMKKWKQDRDAAAAAAAPQQESDDGDAAMLDRLGDVAVRGAVDLNDIMSVSTQRYMTGAEQYSWRKTDLNWTREVKIDVSKFSEELPNEAWDVVLKMVNTTSGRKCYRIEHSVSTPDEKNMMGLNLVKLIDLVTEIMDHTYNEDEALLKDLEIAFNKTLVPRTGAARRIETFYQY